MQNIFKVKVNKYLPAKLEIKKFSGGETQVVFHNPSTSDEGIVSYVADSEDYYGVISKVAKDLKNEILAREPDSLGLCKVVFRPDSSPKTPLEVIVGDAESTCLLEQKGSLQILWDIFGGTVNEKGYKVLNPKVGLIYGEAIDVELQDKIYSEMVKQGWCVSNVLFGVGSWGFLDRSSRDSFSQALKGTHSVVNGKDISMQKNPKTAVGSKKSAKGLLRVEEEMEVLFYTISKHQNKKNKDF